MDRRLGKLDIELPVVILESRVWPEKAEIGPSTRDAPISVRYRKRGALVRGGGASRAIKRPEPKRKFKMKRLSASVST
jgi:hypothetical protein